MRVEDRQVSRCKAMVQKAQDAHRAGHDEGGCAPLQRLEDQAMIVPLSDAAAKEDGTEVMLGHEAYHVVDVLQRWAILDAEDVVASDALGVSGGLVEDGAEAGRKQS